MSNVHRSRRVILVLAIAVIPVLILVWQIFSRPQVSDENILHSSTVIEESSEPLAITELDKLPIKDRATKAGYKRDNFGNGWAKWSKCDTRQRILARDLVDIVYDENGCTVLSGTLHDPYTGEIIDFVRGVSTSNAVQIDHVVALSNAWQTGAQNLDRDTRIALANDDLELLAVQGKANQQKSDSDAAAWLPSNIAFRCQYVARQIAVKIKYALWVTQNEYDAIKNVLNTCPDQRLPAP